MIIHYDQTLDDILALQKDAILHTKYHKIRSAIFLSLVDLFVLLLTFYISVYFLRYYLSVDLVIPVSILISLVAAFLFFLKAKAFYVTTALWQYKMVLKRRDVDDWYENITLLIEDEQIEITVNNKKVKSKTHFNWDAIQKVSQDEERFFLYYRSMDALIIPKRGRNMSERDKIEYHNLIKKHVGHLMVD